MYVFSKLPFRQITATVTSNLIHEYSDSAKDRYMHRRFFQIQVFFLLSVCVYGGGGTHPKKVITCVFDRKKK